MFFVIVMDDAILAIWYQISLPSRKLILRRNVGVENQKLSETG